MHPQTHKPAARYSHWRDGLRWHRHDAAAYTPAPTYRFTAPRA